MTSDQLLMSSNAITVPAAQTDIGLLLPDAGLENWDAELRKRSDSRTPGRQRRSSSTTPGGARDHLARASDITLPQAQYDTYDDTDSFDLLSSGMGIASGEFDPDGGLDLGLDLLGDDDELGGAPAERRDDQGRLLDADGNVIGSEDRDDLSSIGVGRDAASDFGGRQPSILGGHDDITMDLGADGIDFGMGAGDDITMDLGGGPLADQSLQLDDMTPRTKQKVDEAARKQAADAAAKAAKGRKQIEDRVIELADDRGRLAGLGKRPANDEIVQGNFLPSSRVYAELLDMRKDPAARFVGSVLGKDRYGRILTGSDLNVCPELADFFVIDLEANRAAKRARYQEAAQRQESAVPDESREIGRRAADEGAEFLNDGFGYPGDDTTFNLGDDRGAQFDMGMDEMPDMTLGDATLGGADESMLRKSDRVRAQHEAAARAEEADDEEGILAPLSRFATPAPGEGSDKRGHITSSARKALEDDLESFTPSTSRLLAAFEQRPSDLNNTPEDKELAARDAAEDLSASQAASKTGWSKNTIRAQRVVRSQLKKKKDTKSVEEPTLSFENVGENASRRAAAGFFFELLVLGTKDRIQIKQDQPYGDLQIKAKSSLWDDDEL